MDNQSEELFGLTPWQTVGPFFHYCLPWKGAADLAGQSSLGGRPDLLVDGHDHLPTHNPGNPGGELIELTGRVLDGAGDPIPDAFLEIWHADANGNYGSGFSCFGRCATDDDGGFRFTTIRPGAFTDTRDQLHAPHYSLSLYARGIIKRLLTRAYFEGADENAEDPVLALVPASRLPTLMARQDGDAWQFDIRVQGDNETVFFQC